MSLFQKHDDEEHEIVEGVRIIEEFEGPDGDETEPSDPAEPSSAPAADEPSARDDELHSEDDELDSEAAEAETADTEAEDAEDIAEDEEDEGEEDEDDDAPAPLGRKVFVALIVVAVVISLIVGYVIGSGGIGAKGTGSATLTEEQLDTPVASYTYNGATHTITAREAIESQYSLSAVQNEDGTYAAPSAEFALSYARTQIMIADAESRGISVDDDEVDAYAEAMLGTSDYESIASQYGVDEEQAKDIVRDAAMVDKLYQQIVPATDAALPDMPAEPESGDENAASAEYASYIISLAGDEWDSEAGTWASTDGPYYAALGSESFTADSATYAQALSAYYVAYQEYSEDADAASTAWTSYVNGLYADASISIYGLLQ